MPVNLVHHHLVTSHDALHSIVKRHVLEGIAVSNLCDEFQINPTLFYQWQRQLFEKLSGTG
jgi:transposase-like protein